jgi:hypothetical protein
VSGVYLPASIKHNKCLEAVLALYDSRMSMPSLDIHARFKRVRILYKLRICYSYVCRNDALRVDAGAEFSLGSQTKLID